MNGHRTRTLECARMRVLVRAPNWARRRRAVAAGACATCGATFPASRIEVLARPWVARALRRGGRGGRGPREPRALSADARAIARRARRSACSCRTPFAARSRAGGPASPSAGATRPTCAAPLLTRARARARERPGPQPGVLLSGDARRASVCACSGGRPTRRCALPGERGRARGALLGATGRLDRHQPRRGLRRRQALAPGRFAAAAALVARAQRARRSPIARARRRAAALAEAIAAQHGACRRACCAGRRALPDLVGVLSRAARLLLTNDSGPMHVAAALGTPRGRGLRLDRLTRDGAGGRPRVGCERARPLRACAPARVPDRPPLHDARRASTAWRTPRWGLLAGMTAKTPAIFMDRDGTLVARGGLREPPRALPALPVGGRRDPAASTAPACSRCVVTNQAGVARGYFPESVIAGGARASCRRRVDSGRRAPRRGLLLPAPPVAWASRRTAQDCDVPQAAARGCCIAPQQELGVGSRAARGWSATGDADMQLAWSVGAQRASLVKTRLRAGRGSRTTRRLAAAARRRGRDTCWRRSSASCERRETAEPA